MITIIGGGPAGCRTAELLAKQGLQVQVLEEHREIGLPIQCTGIVTRSILTTVKLPNKSIVNRMRYVRIHSPGGNRLKIPNDDIIIDRSVFDKELARRAEHKGAAIRRGTRVHGIMRLPSGDGFKLRIGTGNKRKFLTTEVLVGADGPLSLTAQIMGNNRPQCWTGIQATVKGHFDTDTYDTFFGDRFPGFFGWIVPESATTARVGTAASINPRPALDRLLKRIPKHKVMAIQGGLIPKYNPKTIINAEQAYLVGDAATQVKATTGGGLVPGLTAAKALAASIISETDYRKKLAATERELRASLFLRKTLDRFNDTDYDRLIQLMGQTRVKKVLKDTDRDRPLSLVARALINEPRFAFIGLKIMTNKTRSYRDDPRRHKR